VKNAKSGQVRFRVDKAGIIHCTIGKASFEPEKLKRATSMALLGRPDQKAKPATSKGIFVKRSPLSSTMGVGVMIDQSTLGVW
jgi:large subunit ribosomal protein L1